MAKENASLTTVKVEIQGIIWKTKTVLNYSIDKAKEWADKNARFLFVFDEKAFKDLAKGKNPPDCVTIGHEPDCQLASDLSFYKGMTINTQENLQ